MKKNNLISFSEIEDDDKSEKIKYTNKIIIDTKSKSKFFVNKENINAGLINNNININNDNNLNLNIDNNVNTNISTRKNIIIRGRGVKSYFKNMNLKKKKEKKVKFETRSIKSDKSKKMNKRKIKDLVSEKSHKNFKSKEILESSVSMIEKLPSEKPEKILDDYELNHLQYLEAIQLDKRGFCKVYCSLLMRDQIILSTCVSCNDYNLVFIKIVKFIFLLCTLMAMNAFLFSDKSFHKLFISGVKYYFTQQILQVLLSVLITSVVDVILCFFTMTDKHVYEIKSLPKEKTNNEKVFNILKCTTNKLLIFFGITFGFILFYWFFISAFCAVYPNTQRIFIIDCLLSFVFLAIIPFIVYFLMTLLRIISLKDNSKKRLSCLYKLSQMFPVF